MNELLNVLAALGQTIQGLAAPFSIYFAYRAIVELRRQQTRDSATKYALEVYSATHSCALAIHRARLPSEIDAVVADTALTDYFDLPAREIDRSMSDFATLLRLAPTAEVFFGTEVKACILTVYNIGMSVSKSSRRLVAAVKDGDAFDDELIELKRIVYYRPGDSIEKQLNEELSIIVRGLNLLPLRVTNTQ